jgi:hypothetical protein
VKLLPLEEHGVLTSGRRGFLRSEFDQNALIFTFEPDIVLPDLLDQTMIKSNTFCIVAPKSPNKYSVV